MKGKKSKTKSAAAEGDQENRAGGKGPKSKNTPEGLTLFQNSNLLNQQDPLELLNQQLSQLIQDDVIANASSATNEVRNKASSQNDADAKQACLSVETAISALQHKPDTPETKDNMFTTVKKGVLWQQQDHDKFHQRLFNRWKKRFFILTTDYLVCFKRSTSKVGRSEMGKFLYKVSCHTNTFLFSLQMLPSTRTHSEHVGLAEFSLYFITYSV